MPQLLTETPNYLPLTNADIQVRDFIELTTPVLALEKIVCALYERWNREYCQGQWLYQVGLDEVPYFKYFDYDYLLTSHSGLIQLRKCADIHQDAALLVQLEEVASTTRSVRDKLYKLLVMESACFE